MKAVLQTRYGPPEVLNVVEEDAPAPKGHQVLVKVQASSINAMEWRILAGKPVLLRGMMGGWQKPKDPRIGADVAGVVEAVGEAVTRFQPGDAVFGIGKGAYAEYVLARDKYLASKPAGVSFEAAAATPVAALTALQGFRYAGGVQPGQQVLIQGASGGVGMFAVQLGKHYGGEVTAVVSPRNLDMARQLGADRVIDYTREDPTRTPEAYDLIFAINGYRPIRSYRRALKPGGVYVCAGGALRQMFEAMAFGPLLSRDGKKRLGSMGISKADQDDLEILAGLLESGAIAPVIDRLYTLEDIVEAFRYIEDEHPQGKVVIKPS